MTKKKDPKDLLDRGRPSLYREEFADQLVEFFNISPTREVTVRDKNGDEKVQELPNKFPTLARFATIVGVTRETLHDWATSTNENGELKHPEFSYAYKRAKDFQEAILVEGTMNGAYIPSFAIFTAKNVLGWRDKTEQEVTGKDGAPFSVMISTLDEQA